jgi:flagellar hook-basal body complex protein FliE
MSIDLSSIGSNTELSSLLNKLGSGEKTESSTEFSDILNEAIGNARETEAENDLGNLDLLAGEDVGIHETMVQAEKAELALELALQVRNKVIDAYNEIMRMQL